VKAVNLTYVQNAWLASIKVIKLATLFKKIKIKLILWLKKR